MTFRSGMAPFASGGERPPPVRRTASEGEEGFLSSVQDLRSHRGPEMIGGLAGTSSKVSGWPDAATGRSPFCLPGERGTSWESERRGQVAPAALGLAAWETTGRGAAAGTWEWRLRQGIIGDGASRTGCMIAMASRGRTVRATRDGVLRTLTCDPVQAQRGSVRMKPARRRD